MDEILRLQKLAGILTEIRVKTPGLLSSTQGLFQHLYRLPKYGFDGNLSDEVEQKFINPNNIEWGEDEFLVDLIEKLPQGELKRLYQFLLTYDSPKDYDNDSDLYEIKVNNPNRQLIDKINDIWNTKATTEIPGILLF